MTSILTDSDIDIAPILDKNVAILGYGNQGRPQALNLRDSGVNVGIGTRPDGARKAQALGDGFTQVMDIEEAIDWADVVMCLLPDDVMADVYERTMQARLKPAQYLGFGHGLSIHAGWVTPSPTLNVFLVAPKAQGRGVRNKYMSGSGVPAYYAVHQNPSRDTTDVALAYAKALGCGRIGVFETTFKEETECDLFTEQAVLCGGLTSLIKAAFEVLLEAGYRPETAYFECMYEVKLIADLLHERGITGMREAISSTALFGDVSRGDKVIDAHVKENMRRVLFQIVTGQFAREMQAEFEGGKPAIQQAMGADYNHPIEQTHRRLQGYLKS